jgi:hypothetical protein
MAIENPIEKWGVAGKCNKWRFPYVNLLEEGVYHHR